MSHGYPNHGAMPGAAQGYGMNAGPHTAAHGGFTQAGLDPGQLLRRAWSRRRLLFGVAFIVFALITVIVFSLTPRYTGEARILVEAPPGQVTNPLEPSPFPFADSEKVASEIQVLLSRGLARDAIGALDLKERPEFNPALGTINPLGRARGLVMGRADMPEAAVEARVSKKFHERLSVSQIGNSRVISVRFSSVDPVLARDGANTIADLYILDQRSAALETNMRARAWLAEQIAELRATVAQSEAAVEEFRARTGLLEGAGVQLQSQELSELNSQLILARAARSEAQARVATLQRIVGAQGENDGGIDSALEVLQSPLIQQLRAQEVQLKRELTEMSAELLPGHPTMIQRQAELVDLRHNIRVEVAKVIQSLQNEARIAGARESSLQRDLDRLKGTRATANQDEIELRALEREAAANRNLLESFLARYAEVSARGDISVQEANARVISRAELPDSPSFPQKGPLMMLAAMASVMAGLIAVFLTEMLNRAVRGRGDIEGASAAPVLATLPAVGGAPHDEGMRHPGGAFAQAVSTLQGGLGIGPGGLGRGRVVLVASALPGEGRTTTAIALARTMAGSGLRVLLVDADFRAPRIAQLLGLPGGWGFSDLLMGRAGYAHVITRDPLSAAHVIPAGHGLENPAAVLASPHFMNVLDGLAHAYDAVILDSAPLSRDGGAHLLARAADQCVYAVRWNATPREQAVSGLRRIALSGARGGVGVVLTRAEAGAVI
jgi:succinoglycan biosynthesis transport protein ExoP